MLFCLVVLSVIGVSELQAENRPRKGLWIEAEGVVRPLSDPKEFNKLIKSLHEHAFTDVYVQIYRNGKAWFPSKISDTTPYDTNSKKGFDPLPQLLKYAKAHNIRVHAWMNVLRMGETAPFLKRTGLSAVLHDGSGRSLVETKGEGVPGCRPDTPGIWLDPANRAVRRNALFTIREIISLYPDLSGIHFDYIRYPFAIAGEAKTKEGNCSEFMSLEKLKKAEQGRAMLRSGQVAFEPATLVEDESITDLLRIVRRYIDVRAPYLEISAAVLSNIDRAQKHGKQDWPLWVQSGLLDSVVTMNYTTDEERFLRESKASSAVTKGKVMIGVGAWLSLSKPEVLRRDLKNISDLNTQGVVLFSYANLANANGKKLFKQLDGYPYK